MEIPKAGSVVQLEHKGDLESVVVIDVQQEDGTAFLNVRVQVTEDVFRKGDTVYWIQDDGRKQRTSVQDKMEQAGETFFTVRLAL